MKNYFTNCFIKLDIQKENLKVTTLAFEIDAISQMTLQVMQAVLVENEKNKNSPKTGWARLRWHPPCPISTRFHRSWRVATR
jgi:hypothetical protein